jgi:hypothetical protein
MPWEHRRSGPASSRVRRLSRVCDGVGIDIQSDLTAEIASPCPGDRSDTGGVPMLR